MKLQASIHFYQTRIKLLHMPQLFILTGVIVIWQNVSLPSLHLTHGIENDLIIPLNFIAKTKTKSALRVVFRGRGAGSRHRPTA